MNKTAILLITIMLGICSVSAQDALRISFLNPQPVIVDGKRLNKGDSFNNGEVEIEWLSENQVMKVVNERTKRQYVLSAKAIPNAAKGTLSDYLNVSNQLSTRSASYADNAKKGSVHFLGYTESGSNHTLVPFKGMFMDELPKEIWLCYYDAEHDIKRVDTKDFRSLVDDLIITDALVRRLMAGMDDEQGESYILLMAQFLSKEYRDIPLSRQEIEIYVSLKY